MSVATIAQDLNVSTQQVEGMIQYWVRKGSFREALVNENCGSCSARGSSPFVIHLPKSYELASIQADEELEESPVCSQACTRS